MAFSKNDQFDAACNELSAFAKALSHPARIQILKALALRQSCICGELVEALPLAQSTVSQHLKELKKAGLISGAIDGPCSCYCINWENLSKCFHLIQSLADELKSAGCQC